MIGFLLNQVKATAFLRQENRYAMDTGIKLKHYPDTPDIAQVDKLRNLIILLADAAAPRSWSAFPYANIIRQRLKRGRGKQPSPTPFATDLPNDIGTHVTLATVKPDISPFELLTLARKLAEPHFTQQPSAIALCMPGLHPALALRVAEAVIAAVLAGAYALPHFKSKKDESRRLNTISVFGLQDKPDFHRTFAEATGNNLARYLTALPPNELTPTQYRERIAGLAKEHGWRMRFLDIKALQRENAGAFLAVCQGSPVADAGIVHLHYTPKPSSPKPAVALVGKGICFDTGGTNLKPPKNMYGMHEDMEGSAVALGTLLALSLLQVDFPVGCWLALAQNHIGPNAYKQNDVVSASNGVTIEIMHTDAEGRMVLADTLALASKEKPVLIIDYATLTGSCVHALGTRYSGAFTNRHELMPVITAAGQASGERMWPFPHDADYDADLDSSIADIKQCSLESGPDHIQAARFLDRFIEKDVPWIHIDLASGNHKGGLAHIPTDITAVGVRFTLSLLLDQQMAP
jgi:leucyl aminopeptidase